MDDLEPLRKTLEHYRQQEQQKLSELQRIRAMIAQLETDLGEQPSSAEAASNAVASPSSSIWGEVLAPFRKIASNQIRPDEFFGMNQSDAAKAYLRKVGGAVTFDELVEALRKGGATLGGKDPKKTLYVSLARNPRKEFVWPSTGYVSLAEFYGKKESGS
jgi:hypothetical protein